MKILLINPPNGRLERTYLAPPLGLLTLAAVARENGCDVSVLDFNLEVMADPRLEGERFYDFAVNRIFNLQPDAVGFTSMCLESHVSLELARRVKERSPRVATIFGGTHFGAIARDVIALFPFVDFTVAGESESALPAILKRVAGGAERPPANVYYRENQAVVAGQGNPPPPHLDDLPFPAYDLVDLERYFSLNPARLLNYEAGRGCVFKCTFCYSPFQYGDAVRHKQPANVVRDLRRLADLGARHLFFVQDNLLNSPRWATELCQQLTAAQIPLTWECYVTYPQLNEPLIDALAQAGCIGLFTGIDAVAPDSQVRMNKPFLKNWENISRKLTHCVERGMLPICAFILEGPDQKSESVDATIRTAIECVRLGCEVHINTLSIYNNTMLATNNDSSLDYSYSSLKPELLLDTPLIVQRNEFAKKHPSLFPYHSTHYDVPEWEIFIAKAHTLFALAFAFPQTLKQYALEDKQSIWETLSYINADFVDLIRTEHVGRRRLLALLKFSEHLASLPLRKDTSVAFSRELVSIVLSYQQTIPRRLLSIVVDGEIKRAELAWFINLSKLTKSRGGIRDFIVELLAGSIFSGISLQIDLESDNQLALLSRQKTILVISPELDSLRILSGLEKAAAAGNAVSVGTGQLEQLEREHWIRLLQPEDDILPRFNTMGGNG
jgi:radical SAM superfamily enzyme YgiQ (UPF0313 family)